MTDEAVRELARAASSHAPGRWALVALGGWGAGAMLPASDLDILVLSDAAEAKLKPFVEAVLYPLWDAGLKVGHQVRSPKQQLRAMRDDLATCTAALTARTLTGDAEWAASAIDTWLSDCARHSKRILAELAERERPGSPYLLEPDLKEGAGGRRDYDELVWSAAVVQGAVARDPSPLVAAGFLTADELSRVQAAADVVATARWEVQRRTGRQVMSLDLAEELETVDPEDVQRALGATGLVLCDVRARLTTRARHRERRPVTAAELFGALDRGMAAVPELERAAEAGHLDALAPGLRGLMACRRPGLGHELTVGAHCIKAAAIIGDLTDDPVLRRSMQLADRRVSQASALAHDAGKREGGAGHAERGASAAREIARSLELTLTQADDVAELTRLHLVLVETALHEDVDDEDTVLRCAARIGRAELLPPLHLLIAADSLATGPATWTPWTAALVGTLVSRLDAALAADVDGAGLAVRGEAVRAEALASLGDARGGEREFVSRAPLRYLAGRSAEEVLRDAGLLAELGASAGRRALLGVSPGPAEGTHEVTIVAHDRPELLARLAGALSLAGLDIHSVDAFGAPGRIALDRFVVSSATKRPVTTETFAELERFVDAALRDRLELATRLAQRRLHYPPTSDTALRVETARSGWDTTIRVTAPDRPGLLHDIARAVSAEEVDIRWAKVQTLDGLALDTFHVTGADGGPVDDPGVLGHLAMRIRAAI